MNLIYCTFYSYNNHYKEFYTFKPKTCTKYSQSTIMPPATIETTAMCKFTERFLFIKKCFFVHTGAICYVFIAFNT